jgi:hypothetical protein
MQYLSQEDDAIQQPQLVEVVNSAGMVRPAQLSQC